MGLYHILSSIFRGKYTPVFFVLRTIKASDARFRVGYSDIKAYKVYDLDLYIWIVKSLFIITRNWYFNFYLQIPPPPPYVLVLYLADDDFAWVLRTTK